MPEMMFDVASLRVVGHDGFIAFVCLTSSSNGTLLVVVQDDAKMARKLKDIIIFFIFSDPNVGTLHPSVRRTRGSGAVLGSAIYIHY